MSYNLDKYRQTTSALFAKNASILGKRGSKHEFNKSDQKEECCYFLNSRENLDVCYTAIQLSSAATCSITRTLVVIPIVTVTVTITPKITLTVSTNQIAERSRILALCCHLQDNGGPFHNIVVGGSSIHMEIQNEFACQAGHAYSTTGTV